jgi:hypothetical protein
MTGAAGTAGSTGIGTAGTGLDGTGSEGVAAEGTGADAPIYSQSAARYDGTGMETADERSDSL